MSENTTDDKILRLETRHTELLEQLDALNLRLEETLSGLAKSADSRVDA